MRFGLCICFLTVAAACMPAASLHAQAGVATPKGLALEVMSALRRADLAPERTDRRDALAEAFAITTRLMIRFPYSDAAGELLEGGVEVPGRTPVTAAGITERAMTAGIRPKAPFLTFAYVADPTRSGPGFHAAVIARLLVARGDFETLEDIADWPDPGWGTGGVDSYAVQSLLLAGRPDRALAFTRRMETSKYKARSVADIHFAAGRPLAAFEALTSTDGALASEYVARHAVAKLVAAGHTAAALEIAETVEELPGRAGMLARIATAAPGSVAAGRAERLAREAATPEKRALVWGEIAAARPGAGPALARAIEAARTIADPDARYHALSGTARRHIELGDTSATRVFEAMAAESPNRASRRIDTTLKETVSALPDGPVPTEDVFERAAEIVASLPAETSYRALCHILAYMADAGYSEQAHSLLEELVEPIDDPELDRQRAGVLIATGRVAEARAELARMATPHRTQTIWGYALMMDDWPVEDALGLIYSIEDPDDRTGVLIRAGRGRHGFPR